MSGLVKGDRVRLSDRAVTRKKKDRVGRVGTVMHTPRPGSQDVAVRWDGNWTFEYVPVDWLDQVTPTGEVDPGESVLLRVK